MADEMELSSESLRERIAALERQLKCCQDLLAGGTAPESDQNGTFRVVMDSLDALVYVSDPVMNDIIYINRYGREILGIQENPVGRKCWELIQYGQSGPCDFCTNRYLLDRVANPAGVHVWEFINTVTGRWYHIIDRLIRWVDGRDVRLEIAIDITERKEATEKLQLRTRELEELNRNLEKRVHDEIEVRRAGEQFMIQQSRLAAMGELMGAIAHRWRQPLNMLGIVIQDLSEAYEFNEITHEYIQNSIQVSMQEIMFLSRTIDDFRNFLRPSSEKICFDLVDFVGHSAAVLEAEFESFHIRLQIKIAKGASLWILGYPGELQQAILYILHNARDSILEKRANPSLSDHSEEVRIILRKENHVAFLSIEDDGIGIPESVMERIFDPYFTTKKTGQGIGMGLYMAKIIIERNMDGKLRCQNGIKGGAVFIIEFPLRREESSLNLGSSL